LKRTSINFDVCCYNIAVICTCLSLVCRTRFILDGRAFYLVFLFVGAYRDVLHYLQLLPSSAKSNTELVYALYGDFILTQTDVIMSCGICFVFYFTWYRVLNFHKWFLH